MVRFEAATGLAALALVLLPGASAQANPTATLTLGEVASGTLHTNDTVYREAFVVGLRLANIVCPQESTFEVSLAGAAAPPNATGNLTTAFEFTPSRARFKVPAGQYILTPFSETQEAAALVRPSTIPFGGLELPVTITAQFADNGRCQGQGALPSQQQSAPFSVLFRRSTEPPPPTPAAPEMPAPGALWAGLGLLAAVAVISARRR